MRMYPDQPEEKEKSSTRMDKLRTIIQETLEDELPICNVNAWFLSSVSFANMLDKMMGKVWINV